MFEFYLLLVLLLIILSIVVNSLKIGISPMPTSKKVSYEILKLIKDSKEDTVIDLGSGFGSLAIFLASNLPNKKIIAYELSFFPYLISLTLKKILNVNNLFIYKKDFLKENLKDSILVCYLCPSIIQKLENKIFDETINTKIISNFFSFRSIKAKKVAFCNNFSQSPIFLYKT